MNIQTGFYSSMLLLPAFLLAQPQLQPQGGRVARAAANAKAAAPADLTGQWVSVVTEDWRFRMMVPAKGDYAGIPLNPAGRKLADAWDSAKDQAEGGACKPFGAPGVMRAPGRIRISWADDDTMKIETDAGVQTRMLYFKEPKLNGDDWQGVSRASWEALAVARAANNPNGAGGPAPTGALKVVTTDMKPGYLRFNGVPYSAKAVLTEYFDRTNEPNGDSWLIDTAIVEDPTYLNQPFITSSHFRKETNPATWHPTPCSLPWEPVSTTKMSPTVPTLGKSTDPLVGTWELDLSKSDFTPEAAIRERTLVFSAVDNGVICKMSTLTERGSGRDTTDNTYTAHFDNKDVPIDSSALDTVALKRIDAKTLERTGKIKGKAVETATMKVSEDGKVLTIMTTGTIGGQDYNNIQVFARK